VRKNRGAKNVKWIEKYCLNPSGPDRGRRVRLTREQRDVVKRIYDGNEVLDVTPPLSAYLALLHVCGPEAVLPFSTRTESVRFRVDVFSVWNSAGPDLKAVLRLEAERVLFPQLGTEFKAA
jgi:hypothetical protein